MRPLRDSRVHLLLKTDELLQKKKRKVRVLVVVAWPARTEALDAEDEDSPDLSGSRLARPLAISVQLDSACAATSSISQMSAAVGSRLSSGITDGHSG